MIADAVSRPDESGLGKDFLLLLQGQLVSHLGSQAFLIGVMFWTLEATQSATTMGFFLAATTLPGVLLGPVAGAFVDRWPRKPILLGADLVRGLAAGGLAAMVWLRPDATQAILVCLFSVAVIYGLSGALFQPAVAAAIPDLVVPNRVQNANSWVHASAQLSVLVGQAAGGVLYRLLDAAWLFALDAVSYVLSAFSECWIRFPADTSEPALVSDSVSGSAPAASVSATSREHLADVRAGLALFWNDRGLRYFMLTAAGINFLFMPVFVLLPFYVTDVLDRGSQWYGFLLAALSGGSLVGAFAAATLRVQGRRRAGMLVLILLAVPATAAVLVHVAPAAALALLVVLGVLTGLLNVIVLSRVQLATPAQYRGRLLGILISLSGAATPLGMVAGGLAGDLFTVERVFTAVAVLGVAYVAVMASRRELREFLARRDD